MKLKTPTFPRKGHHTTGSVAPAPHAGPAPQPVAPSAPATALKKVAGGLNTPTRQRNTAAMIAGLAFIIIAGAMGASVASSFDDSIAVLVARDDIEEGATINDEDFRIVQIAAAAGDIEVMAPSSIEQLVGRVAAGPIGKGSMIHPDQFTDPFGEQKVLVGATLGASQYPASGLKRGDQVRLIATVSRSSDEDGMSAGEEITVAEVVDVVPTGSLGLHVSLRVPESSVNVVVQLVSDDVLSMALLDESVTLESVSPLAPGSAVNPQTAEGASE